MSAFTQHKCREVAWTIGSVRKAIPEQDKYTWKQILSVCNLCIADSKVKELAPTIASMWKAMPEENKQVRKSATHRDLVLQFCNHNFYQICIFLL